MFGTMGVNLVLTLAAHVPCPDNLMQTQVTKHGAFAHPADDKVMTTPPALREAQASATDTVGGGGGCSGNSGAVS